MTAERPEVEAAVRAFWVMSALAKAVVFCNA